MLTKAIVIEVRNIAEDAKVWHVVDACDRMTTAWARGKVARSLDRDLVTDAYQMICCQMNGAAE